MAYKQLTHQLLLLMAVSLIACTPQQSDTDTLAITIGKQQFNLETAVTSNQRYQGLSDRKEIAVDGGMLFVFSDAKKRTFVMRKCYVPIDIIFLDPGQRIVAMHAMTVEPYDTPENQLKLYPSQWPAMYAIELAGGTLEKLKLKAGDKIPFELPDALKRQVQ
ncbi:MAG TPA: hypothetical protein DCM28_11220 [Phycisphaerales bacterium]|nr:hypothetical protein [Phycisphaerales bacterium]HCD32994.1 hypothetical protein [Phycisphaerales bacterium]|tara:strand:- start:2912 stop:3397 length:486 start_codon:yes stop_codon:yes gene_type:complete